jgi:S-adenosylmethionine/arginine decarboxylase-like enzyme
MSKERTKKYIHIKNNILLGETWQVTLKRLYQHYKLYSIIYNVCKIIQMVTLAVISATVCEDCPRS